MATELLRALREKLSELPPVEDLTEADDGLSGVLRSGFGDITLRADHDPEAEAIRVSARTPAPPGAGHEFLIWCLALNAQYWDVKLALDEDGQLLVHADVDAEESAKVDTLSVALSDRIETMVQLLEDDLRSFLLEKRMGTPAQMERWAETAESEEG